MQSTGEKGPKVIIAQSECMLNKQRRVKPLLDKAEKAGKRVVRERFGNSTAKDPRKRCAAVVTELLK